MKLYRSFCRKSFSSPSAQSHAHCLEASVIRDTEAARCSQSLQEKYFRSPWMLLAKLKETEAISYPAVFAIPIRLRACLTWKWRCFGLDRQSRDSTRCCGGRKQGSRRLLQCICSRVGPIGGGGGGGWERNITVEWRSLNWSCSYWNGRWRACALRSNCRSNQGGIDDGIRVDGIDREGCRRIHRNGGRAGGRGLRRKGRGGRRRRQTCCSYWRSCHPSWRSGAGRVVDI